MNSWHALPDAPLLKAGLITAAFVNEGAGDYRAAAKMICELAYGRNRDSADPLAVLREGKGTCSTKHALLARLALEQDIPVALRLGIYRMTGRNTPGVGAVLARHGLDSLPEAHCYLFFAGERIDVTRQSVPAQTIDAFIHEETIAPEQIGAYKIALHQRFIGQWRESIAALSARSLQELWNIREQCIAALSSR